MKGAPKGHKKYGGGMKKGQKIKKTMEQEKALGVLREEIRKHWKPLLHTKLRLAKGLYIEKRIPMGKKKMKVIVYRKEPDSNSLEWLFEMVVGKPTQSQKLEMSGEIDIGISELAKSLQKIYEIATENNNSEKSNKGNS